MYSISTSEHDGDFGPGGRNIIVNMYHVITMNLINLQFYSDYIMIIIIKMQYQQQ